MRIDSRLQRVATNIPSAANGSVSARNVSGAISVTPTLSTGQLQPQMKVSNRIGTSACAIGCAASRAVSRLTCFPSEPAALRRTWTGAARGLRDPAVAADAARKLGELGVDLVDVALAPARDLPIRGHAQTLQHAFQHRADADDELQVVERVRSVEQWWQRVVFEVHHEFAIACRLRLRIRHIAQQNAAIRGEVRELQPLRLTGRQRAAQGIVFDGQAAHQARLLRADAVIGGTGVHGCANCARRRQGCRRRRRATAESLPQRECRQRIAPAAPGARP